MIYLYSPKCLPETVLKGEGYNIVVKNQSDLLEVMPIVHNTVSYIYYKN